MTDTLTSSAGTAADRERENLYRASRERHHARIEGERRAAWIRYHEAQAERLEETAAALAREHRERASELRAEGARP